jgi:NADPH:quinone reductase-like Zn-dependent oxidoreductase
MRTGSWPSGLVAPHALGVEAAGVVIEIGAEVPTSYQGAEVLGHVFPFPEWDVGAAGDCAGRPAGPSPCVVAVAGRCWDPGAALTAMQALRSAGDGVTGRVVVHGAGGLTGGLIAQLAAASGGAVVATAGRTSADRLLAAGVRHVVDRAEPSWADDVRELCGGSVGVAFNAVPGGAIDLLPLVGSAGQLVSIAGPVPASDRVSVRAVTVEADVALLAQALIAFVDGHITIPPVRRYPLEAAAQALGLACDGAHGAAVVLDMADSDES